jgi:hypothetical protein
MKLLLSAGALVRLTLVCFLAGIAIGACAAGFTAASSLPQPVCATSPVSTDCPAAVRETSVRGPQRR